jgi:hypothetical protein
MKKQILSVVIGTVFIAILSGCSSIDTAARLNNQKLTAVDADPIAHLNGDAWGVYLFNLPILTGSTNYPGTCAIFKDSVTVDKTVYMVTRRSRELGASKITDLQSSQSSNMIFPLFIFFVREVQVSGNAIK